MAAHPPPAARSKIICVGLFTHCSPLPNKRKVNIQILDNGIGHGPNKQLAAVSSCNCNKIPHYPIKHLGFVPYSRNSGNEINGFKYLYRLDYVAWRAFARHEHIQIVGISFYIYSPFDIYFYLLQHL